MFKIFKFIKDSLLLIPITLIFYPFSKFFLFVSYFNKMLIWIYKNNQQMLSSDYFTLLRDYSKRKKLYQFLLEHYQLENKKMIYLEYGVASGESFKWWLENNKNQSSRFYGFDTFEGLPESWGGFYNKGDMSHEIPNINDNRGNFIKGLFQDTLPSFINNEKGQLNENTLKVIHLDADLYSATIFTLSQLYPYIKKGDIILFDEFNVAMHEFKAYLEFTSNYYVKLKPVVAVNNFYQVAFEVQ